MNSSVAAFSFFVVVALAGMGGAQALTYYTCYNCNNVTTPACGQTFGVSTGVPTSPNCTCCTKTLSGNVVTRGCISNTGSLDGGLSCVGNVFTINSYTCTGNTCNAATSLRLPATGAALLAAVALALGMYGRQ